MDIFTPGQGAAGLVAILVTVALIAYGIFMVVFPILLIQKMNAILDLMYRATNAAPFSEVEDIAADLAWFRDVKRKAIK